MNTYSCTDTDMQLPIISTDPPQKKEKVSSPI